MFRGASSSFRFAGNFGKAHSGRSGAKRHFSNVNGAFSGSFAGAKSRGCNRSFASMPNAVPHAMRIPASTLPPEIQYLRTQYLQGRFFTAPVTTTTSTSLSQTDMSAPSSSATAESDGCSIASSVGGSMDGMTSPVTDTLTKLNYSYSIIDVAMLLQLRHTVIPVLRKKVQSFNLMAKEKLALAASPLAAFTPEPAVDTVNQVVHQIGDLKAMGLCNNTPIGALQYVMEAVHVTSGLPWWISIALTTVLIRTLLLPIVLNQQRMQVPMMKLRPEMDAIKLKLTEYTSNGQQMEAQKERLKLQQLFKEHKINPLAMFMPSLLSAIVFMCFFWAIKRMADLPVPGFEDGGAAWFKDLTKKDPYYFIPISSMLSTLAIIEFTAEMGSSMSSGMKTFVRFMMLVSFPVMSSFPAAVHCYWFSSNVFMLAFTFLTRFKGVKKFFKIPVLDENAKKMLFKSGTASASAGLFATKKLSFTESWKSINAINRAIGAPKAH